MRAPCPLNFSKRLATSVWLSRVYQRTWSWFSGQISSVSSVVKPLPYSWLRSARRQNQYDTNVNATNAADSHSNVRGSPIPTVA